MPQGQEFACESCDLGISSTIEENEVRGVSTKPFMVVSEEDQLRANVYGLLARFLTQPPSGELLAEAAKLTGDDSPVGRGFAELADMAGSTSPKEAAREYQTLFIGMGRGELLPYASYYLTGFLHEKPLARLRVDMRGLGVTKKPKTAEPEDHIAAVMDIMAGLILGIIGRDERSEQLAFFENHVLKWAPFFFRDLEKAQGARLYKPLGSIGAAFMQIEESAFEMG